MASNTKITEAVRKNKETKRGKERKRLIRKNGTTPKFPIHKNDS